MKTLRPLLLFIMLLYSWSGNNAHAQNWSIRSLDNLSRVELGAYGGSTLYFGDLTPDKRNYLNEITPHGGLLIRYNLKNNFSLRGNIAIAKLSANDSKYGSPEWRQHRNFSFNTVLYEMAAMLEHDLLRTNREDNGNKWGVYAFAGLGLAFTDPKRDFSKIDPAYLGSDDKAVTGLEADQRKSSGHIGLLLPVGLGVSYQASRRISLFAEGSLRHGFDDQIDGFSESVNSSKTDAYALFSLGLNLRMNSRGWWR